MGGKVPKQCGRCGNEDIVWQDGQLTCLKCYALYIRLGVNNTSTNFPEEGTRWK